MKIAISSTGQSEESQVDQRFGRCQFFALYDTESKTYEFIANEAKSASGGAGVQSAQTVAQSGAGTVLTGNVGPNAFQGLQAAKIAAITGVTGTVAEAVAKYASGEYSSSDQPTVGSHFGMA